MLKIRIIILFCIFLFGVACSTIGKKDIDYNNKRVIKKISKVIDKKEFILLANENLNSKSEHFTGKFFNVASEDSIVSDTTVYIGRVKSCRAGGCNNVDSNSNDTAIYEYFDYFIVFDANKTVMRVYVFNYQSPHGYEITSRSWLKQFIGYGRGEDTLKVGKNIDSISGATISVNSITFDVQEKTNFLKSL